MKNRPTPSGGKLHGVLASISLTVLFLLHSSACHSVWTPGPDGGDPMGGEARPGKVHTQTRRRPLWPHRAWLVTSGFPRWGRTTSREWEEEAPLVVSAWKSARHHRPITTPSVSMP